MSSGLYNALRSSAYLPEIRKREGMNLLATVCDRLSPGDSPNVFASFVFPNEHGKLTDNVKNRLKVHYQKWNIFLFVSDLACKSQLISYWTTEWRIQTRLLYYRTHQYRNKKDELRATPNRRERESTYTNYCHLVTRTPCVSGMRKSVCPNRQHLGYFNFWNAVAVNFLWLHTWPQ